jgi:phosphoribosyl-ATP pyrophosphohydrolase
MDTLQALYSVILDRQNNPQEGSYTCYLFDKGIDKILKKVGEECSETIIAAKNGKNEETVYEISDLIYHLLVMMASQGIPLEDVMTELEGRAKKIGCVKQMRVTDKNS